MKNLRERIKEADGGVFCPIVNDTCIHFNFPNHYSDCAHYNPDTNECIHVEAAMAQVVISESLRILAGTVRVNRWGESSITVTNKGL